MSLNIWCREKSTFKLIFKRKSDQKVTESVECDRSVKPSDTHRLQFVSDPFRIPCNFFASKGVVKPKKAEL
jgi:hypothetical protein